MIKSSEQLKKEILENKDISVWLKDQIRLLWAGDTGVAMGESRYLSDLMRIKWKEVRDSQGGK